jgi:hypothetical protein
MQPEILISFSVKGSKKKYFTPSARIFVAEFKIISHQRTITKATPYYRIFHENFHTQPVKNSLLMWKLKVHYHVHKYPPLGHIQIQLNPVHAIKVLLLRYT